MQRAHDRGFGLKCAYSRIGVSKPHAQISSDGVAGRGRSFQYGASIISSLVYIMLWIINLRTGSTHFCPYSTLLLFANMRHNHRRFNELRLPYYQSQVLTSISIVPFFRLGHNRPGRP